MVREEMKEAEEKESGEFNEEGGKQGCIGR